MSSSSSNGKSHDNMSNDVEKDGELTEIPGSPKSDEVKSEKPSPSDPEPPQSVDADGPQDQPNETTHTYPEGGLQSWLTVFGAWSAMVGGLGLMNTISPLQTYISTHQLRSRSPASVAWIFSTYAFISFFCSLQIGPIFDAYGPRVLVLAGSCCLVVSMMLLGECGSYWCFMLDFSFLAGLGTSMILTPSLAAIGHFFDRRRAFATGIAMTGPSTGGIVFPLIFRAVFPPLGFAWATRMLGFTMVFLFVLANLFLRSRLPRQKGTLRSVLPDFRIFWDGDGGLVLATAGLFLMELGLFIPIGFLTSYCVAHGIDESFSYQIVAILNAASVLGRCLPGFVADKAGRYNTMTFMLFLCMLVNLCIWLPASIANTSSSTTKSLAIVFAVFFGFTSGSNLGLIGPVLGQLCETSEYGRYFATSYTFVSFSTLIGIPIGGSLIEVVDGKYWGLIVFTGLAYGSSAVCMGAVRVIKVGWGLRGIF